MSLDDLASARQMALELNRGTISNNVMYFETGQGSALSADASHSVDQQTLEARAYGVARVFDPLLVNTVVGFIGPEYLFDAKQIIRAGIEDHFCGKLLGVPGADDIMLNYQSTSFHDAAYIRTLLGKSPSPEFAAWLEKVGIYSNGRLSDETGQGKLPPVFERLDVV